MHRLLTAVLTLGALALPAAAEAATPTVDYRVVIDGSLDYNRADVDEGATAQHDEAIDFTTTIPQLGFFGDVAEDSRGALGKASVTRGSYVITGENGLQVRCSSHEVSDVSGGGLDATPQATGNLFAARVVDSIAVTIGGCDVPGMDGWQLPLDSAGAEVGTGRFDGAFTIPHSRIGEAQMTFPLKGEVTGGECPLHHSGTVICSLTWDATVTFTRIGAGVVEEPTDDELLVPLMAKAKLAKNLSKAILPVRCGAACAGTLVAAVGGKAIARAPFDGTRAVVRFDKADRKAIRRAGKVKLTVRADGVRRSVGLAV